MSTESRHTNLLGLAPSSELGERHSAVGVQQVVVRGVRKGRRVAPQRFDGIPGLCVTAVVAAGKDIGASKTDMHLQQSVSIAIPAEAPAGVSHYCQQLCQKLCKQEGCC